MFHCVPSVRETKKSNNKIHLTRVTVRGGEADRAPYKFKSFKPCLKAIQILADNVWLKNA